MAPRSRRRPLFNGNVNEKSFDGDDLGNDSDGGVDFRLDDDVEAFVAKRHAERQQRTVDSDDEGDVPEADEPEVYETAVLPVDMSDSDDGDDEAAVQRGFNGKKGLRGGLSDGEDDGEDDSDSDDDDEGMGGGGDDDGRDWGTKRRNWYGGDTHEYEIMSGDERDDALHEEEKEALHMQKNALSNMRPEDFLGDDDANDDRDDDDDDGRQKKTKKDGKRAQGTLSADSDSDSESDIDILPVGGDSTHDADASSAPDASTKGIAQVAPEVPLLLEEAVQVEGEIESLAKRAQKGKNAALLYHACMGFLCNVAFYLALRSDPSAVDVNFKVHPVLARIVRLRTSIEGARKLVEEEGDGVENGSGAVQNGEELNGEVEEEADEVDAVEEEGKKEKKRKSGSKGKKTTKEEKKKRKRMPADATENGVHDKDAFVEDDDVVTSLIRSDKETVDSDDSDGKDSRKRRKLNQLVGAMERDRKNKSANRITSADADVLPDERRMQQLALRNSTGGVTLDDMKEDTAIVGDRDDAEGDEGTNGTVAHDDDEVVRKMLRKKEKRDGRKARKAAEAAKPHVYTFSDRVDADAKRKASTQVIKNRGLMRYRPRSRKTPRTRNRMAYDKAVQRRKSVTKEYEGIPGPNYSGEARGINMGARQGSRLSTV